MNTNYAKPGQVVNLHGESRLETLLETAAVQVSRVVLPAGEKHRSHNPKAEMLVVCLEGEVRAYVKREQPTLRAGQALRLPAGDPCALDGVAEAVLLLINVQRSKQRPADEVDQASEQSFPASDPPPFTPLQAVGTPQ